MVLGITANPRAIEPVRIAASWVVEGHWKSDTDPRFRALGHKRNNFPTVSIAANGLVSEIIDLNPMADGAHLRPA